MPKRSAGIVAYRRRLGGIEVLLAHPGGPFWTKKDDGAWSIPKGPCTETEGSLEAAKREFKEEIGMAIDGAFTHLGEFSQPGGKIILAWAVEADLNEADFKSNLFEDCPGVSSHLSLGKKFDAEMLRLVIHRCQ